MNELSDLKEKIENIKKTKNRYEGEIKALGEQYSKLINDLKSFNLTPENLTKEIDLQKSDLMAMESQVDTLLKKVEEVISQ